MVAVPFRLCRKTAFVAAATVLVVGLPGCSSGDEGAGAGERTPTSTPSATSAPASTDPSEEIPSDKELEERELESVDPTAARTPGTVLVPVMYEVESSAGAVYVSYRDLEGDHQITQAPPWKREFEAQVRKAGGGRQAGIVASVQQRGTSGKDHVTCRITVDGREVVEKTGTQVAHCMTFTVYLS